MRRSFGLALIALMLKPALCAGADLSKDPPRLDDLAATRMRPLFVPSRRPPAPPIAVVAPVPEPAPPPPPQPPDLTLVGIVMGAGSPLVLVKRPSEPKTLNLSLGEAIDGWTIVSVESRRISLERDHRVVTVSMPEPNGQVVKH